MATRLYLHDAANPISGTFPGSAQSALTQNYASAGATTLRTMNATIGTGPMVSSAGTSLAQNTVQNGLYGMFCSQPFDVNQSVGGGGQTLTINIANRESSLSMNLGTGLSAMLYVWRPSTGALVGTVSANLALTGDLEPTVTSAARSNQGTVTTTTLVNALAGDVLICEVWQTHTQALNTAYTGTFYYDGATVTTSVNTTVTNHASFVNFSADNLTFVTQATGTLSFTTEAASLSATGFQYDPVAGDTSTWDIGIWDISVWDKLTGTLSFTTGNASLVGAATAPVRGSLSFTTGAATLNGVADVAVRGSLNFTTGAATLSATGKVSLVAGLNITAATVIPTYAAGVLAVGGLTFTTGDATLAATSLGPTPAVGSLNFTTAGVTFVGIGRATAGGALSFTTGAATLSATSLSARNGSLNFTTASAVLSATGTSVPLVPEVPAMNQAFYTWLQNRGFTGSLDDMINQYLKSVVVASASTDTTNDLWEKYAAQEGYASANAGVQAIQEEWAKAQGAAGDTWNDVFRNLPA